MAYTGTPKWCINGRLNIALVLNGVSIRQVPPPSGDPTAPFRAVLLDLTYEPQRGVVCLVRVLDGSLSEKKKVRKWDETHLPPQVTLPRQVLIIGDGQAEKRSYDEHGNQARIYAGRPGHEAVAQVLLKGLFLKDGPSFEELVLQMRWAAAHVASTILPAGSFRALMWDLTSFPEWTCSEKVGANAYQPLSRGSLIADPSLLAGLSGGSGGGGSAGGSAAAAAADEEMELQMAIAASMAEGAAAQQGGAAASAAAASAPRPPDAAPKAVAQDADEETEEERAMKEAIALSLS